MSVTVGQRYRRELRRTNRRAKAKDSASRKLRRMTPNKRRAA